jgi:hypothetical protein
MSAWLPPVSEIRYYLWARGCRIINRSAPIRPLTITHPSAHNHPSVRSQSPIRPLTITHRSGVQSDRSNRNTPDQPLSLNRPALTPTIERPS